MFTHFLSSLWAAVSKPTGIALAGGWPSALILLTAKARATSSLREVKQMERNIQSLLQVHQPEAELGNSTQPQPSPALCSSRMIQLHEEHQHSGGVPPEQNAFQKPTNTFFHTEDLHSNIQDDCGFPSLTKTHPPTLSPRFSFIKA